MEALTQYRILNQLGSQKNRTFGNVYLLEHKETLTKAVLKHVKKATVKENMYARLRSEATFDFEAQGLPKTIYFQENEIGHIEHCIQT
jgi:serine/threonine protein kinase